jgi:hypothetical protein
VDMLKSPEELCLTNRTPGLPVCPPGVSEEQGCVRRSPTEMPIHSRGKDVEALWMVAGSSDMIADLGPVVTKALREESSLQGDPAAWEAMQKRLEPAGLVAAGYRICEPGADRHNAFRVCYCRDG